MYNPVGIFWDIENCSVPKNKSVCEIISHIRNSFVINRLNNREFEFLIACDVTRIKNEIRDDINKSGGVTLAHVNGNSKNAADEKLRESMKRFVDTHSSSSNGKLILVLISSDIDFVNDLRGYQARLGCAIILVHSATCSPQFKIGWNEIWAYQDICAAVPSNAGAEASPTKDYSQQPQQSYQQQQPQEQQSQQRHWQQDEWDQRGQDGFLGRGGRGRGRGHVYRGQNPNFYVTRPQDSGETSNQEYGGQGRSYNSSEPDYSQYQQQDFDQGSSISSASHEEHRGRGRGRGQFRSRGHGNGILQNPPPNWQNSALRRSESPLNYPEQTSEKSENPPEYQFQNQRGGQFNRGNRGFNNNRRGHGIASKSAQQFSQSIPNLSSPSPGQGLPASEPAVVHTDKQKRHEYILMVSGISERMGFQTVKDRMQEDVNPFFGRVKYVNNGAAFITFTRVDSANRAAELYHGKEFFGNILSARFVHSIPFHVRPLDNSKPKLVSGKDGSKKPNTAKIQPLLPIPRSASGNNSRHNSENSEQEGQQQKEICENVEIVENTVKQVQKKKNIQLPKSKAPLAPISTEILPNIDQLSITPISSPPIPVTAGVTTMTQEPQKNVANVTVQAAAGATIDGAQQHRAVASTMDPALQNTSQVPTSQTLQQSAVRTTMTQAQAPVQGAIRTTMTQAQAQQQSGVRPTMTQPQAAQRQPRLSNEKEKDKDNCNIQ